MSIPVEVTPELDLRDIILEISTNKSWGLVPSQIIVGGFSDNFRGNPIQISIDTPLSDVNAKWQVDTFTFSIRAVGSTDANKVDCYNALWAIHNALIGADTIYTQNKEVSWQHFKTVIAPYDAGGTPERRPYVVSRLSGNRQILVDRNNRFAI